MLGRRGAISSGGAASLRPSSPVPASYKKEVPPPTETTDKVQLHVSSQLAALPYHQDISRVKDAASSKLEPGADFSRLGNWDIDKDLSSKLAESGDYKLREDTGLISDKKTGLVAMVVKNPETKEIRLIFGGTTSGTKQGGLNKRMVLNGGSTLKQWGANIKNAIFGKTPHSYRQAKALTDELLRLTDTKSSGYEDYSVVLSGHSKGAGEATYAALNRAQPLKAECFCSAQLGSGMQNELPESSKTDADKYVSHYNIKGDVVPKLGNMRNGLGHIGNVTTFSAEHAWNSPVQRHDRFDLHIGHYANKPIEAH
ncbi:lipase family protein [Parendozoicomonas sp. Alg238-R29]|uniref:lipase family protein n=1 Tax=Parendozoicomonas sp. Alg238-R29 TaxID=2993446 RepID=UPI00248D8AE7|nr:lipase family protein [Parendozoicomonas sp. Alg238-R29]